MNKDKLAPVMEILESNPVRAIDVGARNGIVSAWQPFLTLMEVDAIEPDRAECDRQSASAPPNVKWHACALAGETGPRTLYVLNTPSGSSLYPPAKNSWLHTSDDYWGVREKREIDCVSFADFLNNSPNTKPNLIKLDTQGSELEILQSLKADAWDDLLAIQVEVEFVELYERQPLFHDIDTFLRSKGLRLYFLDQMDDYLGIQGDRHYFMRKYLNAKKRARSIRNPVLAADAIYMRDFQDDRAFSNRSTLIKFLVILLIYRFTNYALWLLHRAEIGGFLSKGEVKVLTGVAVQTAPPLRPSEINSRRGHYLARLLKFIGEDS